MYLNRWVLVVSAIIGVVGAVTLAGAFSEYRDAVRAYTQLEITHDPASVRWNVQRTAITLRLVVTNHATASATVEYLDLRLDADGTFVGADYENWRPLLVASGASERRAVTLELTDPGTAEGLVAGRAALAVRGEARVRFAGIARPVTLRVWIVPLAGP